MGMPELTADMGMFADVHPQRVATFSTLRMFEQYFDHMTKRHGIDGATAAIIISCPEEKPRTEMLKRYLQARNHDNLDKSDQDRILSASIVGVGMWYQYMSNSMGLNEPKMNAKKDIASEAATINVNATFTGDPGTQANVTNIGNSSAALLDFKIPRGADGSNSDSGIIYYFNNTNSGIPTYESLRIVPSTATQIDESVSISSGTGPVLVDSYATVGAPNVTVIPAGLWEFHTYNYISSNVGTTTELIEVYNRTTTGGTETLLFSVTTDSITATSAAATIKDYVQENDIPIATTDVLVVKIYGQTTAVPAKTFHFVYQGNTNTSHIHTPLSVTLNSCLNDPNCAYLPGRANGQTLTGSTSTGGLTLNGSYSLGQVDINPFGGNVRVGGNLNISSPATISVSVKATNNNAESAIVARNDLGYYGAIESFGSNFVTSSFRNRLLFSTSSGVSDFYISTASNIPLVFATNGVSTERMRITGSGLIGINTAAPTAQLDLATGDFRYRNCSGSITFNATGYGFCSSDAKLKKNVVPLTAGLNVINAVTPKTGEYTASSGLPDGTPWVGFVAQDIKAVYPQAIISREDVKTTREITKAKSPEEKDVSEIVVTKMGTDTLNYDDRALISVLWKALQEEDAKNSALEKRVADLELKLEKAGIK